MLSVIIIFNNEALSALLRTVWSVLDRDNIIIIIIIIIFIYIYIFFGGGGRESGGVYIFLRLDGICFRTFCYTKQPISNKSDDQKLKNTDIKKNLSRFLFLIGSPFFPCQEILKGGIKLYSIVKS